MNALGPKRRKVARLSRLPFPEELPSVAKNVGSQGCDKVAEVGGMMSSSHGMSPSVAGILSYLHNALDAVDAFVLVYDADERFVACNKRCPISFSKPRRCSRLGTRSRKSQEVTTAPAAISFHPA